VQASNRKALVEQERCVRTYAELWHASECFMDTGEREPIGSAWQFLASIVLTSFAFEAYLNHVGAQVLSSWATMERLSPESKLQLICETLGIDRSKQFVNFSSFATHWRTAALKRLHPGRRRPISTNWMRTASSIRRYLGKS
jgi:hypothetical protein